MPVRPCDVDSRGCRDFGGYGDKKLSELEAPEFNNRLDFLREAYAKKLFNLGDNTDFFLKVGKQQVVWGRTDLFRVLDVINPVDYSRNNIYDELQDIRIPMWIAQGEWRFGGAGAMQERNLQVVWNFDKFRPNNLGQCGTPNAILDAGCFFRGMANLWDNGGTVANFAGFSAPGTPAPVAGPWFATNFGANQIGIRNVHLPDWSLSNTQLGMKFEGVTQGGLNFSVNALTYRSQLPSLRSINAAATNPFTGASGNSSPFSGPAQGIPTTHLIAFDVYYPRVNLLGGSMDFQVEAAGAAIRLEGALTQGEEFANSARPELYSKNKVWRSVVGIDRPTFIPFINPHRTTLLSAQLFWQHIFNHELTDAAGGPGGHARLERQRDRHPADQGLHDERPGQPDPDPGPRLQGQGLGDRAVGGVERHQRPEADLRRQLQGPRRPEHLELRRLPVLQPLRALHHLCRAILQSRLRRHRHHRTPRPFPRRPHRRRLERKRNLHHRPLQVLITERSTI